MRRSPRAARCLHIHKAVVEILNDISSFTNLTFTPGSHEGATLRFAEATTINYSNNNAVLGNTGLHSPGGRNSAEANPPEEGFNGGAPTSAKYAQGDSWFNQMNYNTPTLGTFAYFSGLMHEIGHNLGLKHSYAAGSAHGVAFPSLPANHDSYEYSVMTYAQFIGDPPLSLDDALHHRTTYMQDDIAALQYLYGANFNSTVRITFTSGVRRPARCRLMVSARARRRQAITS